jgi:hypothetical protein
LLQDYGAFSLYDPMVKTGKQRFAIGRDFFYYGLKVSMSMKNHKYSLTGRNEGIRHRREWAPAQTLISPTIPQYLTVVRIEDYHLNCGIRNR